MAEITSFHGAVMGFSSPHNYTVCDQTLLVTAGSDVITTANNISTLWRLTEGKYNIHHITSNRQGVLCVSEKRLSARLLFYNFHNKQRTQIVENIATSEIQHMCFSNDDRTLFVLCTVNENSVKVLQQMSNGLFKHNYTVSMENVYYNTIVPVSTCFASAAFAAFNDEHVVIYAMYNESVYNKCFDVYCGKSNDNNSKIVNSNECASKNDSHGNVTCVCNGKENLYIGTTSGHICCFDFATATTKEIAIDYICDLGAITSLLIIDDWLYIATQNGCLFCYNIVELAIRKVCTFTLAIYNISLYANNQHSLCVAAQNGIYHVEVDYTNEDETKVTALKRRSASVVKCLTMEDNKFVLVCVDGSLVCCSLNAVEEWSNLEKLKVTDACLIANECIIVVSEDGTVQLIDMHNGEILWSETHKNFNILMCAANDCTRDKFVVCSARIVRFYEMEEMQVVSCGCIRTDLNYGISCIRWCGEEDMLLVACDNGELYLLNFPSRYSGDCEHSVEALAQGMWRLDFPLFTFIPCYIDSDWINLLVHSADKETKLYIIERRRDVDSKVLRPLILIRDHDSGGTCMCRCNDNIVVSGGKDGRLLLRDVSHYQSRLTPAPPSKEKRRPIFEIKIRPYSQNAITQVNAIGEVLIATGTNAVVHLVCPLAASQEMRWVETEWDTKQMLRSSTHDVFTEQFATTQSKNVQKEIITTMPLLCKQWEQVMQHVGSDVPVETLLTEEDVVKFRYQVQNAIDEMRTSEYYHVLENEYVQDVIMKRCCDSMDIYRTKISGMTNADLEVHNFHISSSARKESVLARKVINLRLTELEQADKENKTSLISKTITETQNTAQCDAVKVNNDDSHDANNRDNEDDRILVLLFPPDELTTEYRGKIQILLLKARILNLKEKFNSAYDALRNEKQNIINEIVERTRRCRKIMRQLKIDNMPLYFAAEVREEDDTTLFKVFDDELPRDVRQLIPHTPESLITAPEKEAALRLWMDGLEKDMEVLEVQTIMPDFANENSDAFVPTEERSEEQTREFEQYEKRVREEVQRIETLKETMQEEFDQLQKMNEHAAKVFDDKLAELRQERVNIAEKIGELELYIAIITNHFLSYRQLITSLSSIYSKQEELRGLLWYYNGMLHEIQTEMNVAQQQMNSMQRENVELISTLEKHFPFNDVRHGAKMLRRFTRWRQKFEDGKVSTTEINNKFPEDVPTSLQNAYEEWCIKVARMSNNLVETITNYKRIEHEESEAKCKCQTLESRLNDLHDVEEEIQTMYNLQGSNVTSLFHVQQGQIQDEKALTTNDFANAHLRRTTEVLEHNKSIYAQFDEYVSAIKKYSQRMKYKIRVLYDTRRLVFATGTLQMELRQLHTMRVTREMHEWLSGDGGKSEVKVINDIDRHIAILNERMEKKMTCFHNTVQKLRCTLSEQKSQNALMQHECQQLRSTLDDAKRVKQLVDAHSSDLHSVTSRAKELYVTSELEETARVQQETLIQLKHEVDRLRERTFPSFAVVSKQNMETIATIAKP